MIKCFRDDPKVIGSSAFIFHSDMKGLEDYKTGKAVLHVRRSRKT